MSERKKLIEFASNVYSQGGEDGVIQKLLEIIGPGQKVCCEFGAWDGFCNSNTANLWTHGWKGILIECNPERYQKLSESVKKYNILALNYSVGIHPPNSLDSILSANKISDDIDVLSIDIDGNDYHVFRALTIRPRIVLVEYNPTIPHHIDLYAEYDNYFGSSVAALIRAGKELGYTLACVTTTNCIFVRDAFVSLLEPYELDPDKIANRELVNYLITSFSGEYIARGKFVFGLTGPCNEHLKGDVTNMKREILAKANPVRKFARQIYKAIFG